MDRDELREALSPLPVWDTHTHLIGAALPARSFWEIGHYFWFLRELVAAGYPADHRTPAEDERIDAFVRAYHGHAQHGHALDGGRILHDLYGLRITDAASVRAADEAIRAAGGRGRLAQRVCRAGRRSGASWSTSRRTPPSRGLPATSCLVPRVEAQLGAWLARLAAAADRAPPATRCGRDAPFAGYAAAGCGGVMTSLEAFGPSRRPARLRARAAPGRAERPAPIRPARRPSCCHALCRGRRGARPLPSAPSLGIERRLRAAVGAPVNDPRRLLRLYSLFRDYRCQFELVLGSSMTTSTPSRRRRSSPTSTSAACGGTTSAPAPTGRACSTAWRGSPPPRVRTHRLRRALHRVVLRQGGAGQAPPGRLPGRPGRPRLAGPRRRPVGRPRVAPRRRRRPLRPRGAAPAGVSGDPRAAAGPGAFPWTVDVCGRRMNCLPAGGRGQ